MKVAFGGDTSFHNSDFNYNSLKKIKSKIKDCYLTINLESPILKTKLNPKKKKGGLSSFPEIANNLKLLSPFLINLGNNHVNDYGNKGVEETQEFLKRLNFNYLGAGRKSDFHNLFIDENNKVLYLSYVTRETDNTGAPLFNKPNFKGPKKLSKGLFLKQSKKYPLYKKIILLHWGEEYVSFPSLGQRKIARNLIDCGADLIIGSHSHTVQGYEKYNGKYIFYSLGNFVMPNIKSFETGKIKVRWGKKENYSIIPIFLVKNKIKLKKIIFLRRNGNVLELIKKKDLMEKLNKPFQKADKNYSQFHKKALRNARFRRLIESILSGRIILIIWNRLNK